MIGDTNAILNSYLTTSSVKVAPLIALVAARIYCPRLPHNVTLPAINYFTRGGESTPYIPGIPEPSVQFDCWADSPIGARQVYRALYNALQGIQNVNAGSVIVVGSDGNDYSCILAHTATARNEPITGTNWATYWVATGGTGIGSAWLNGTAYRTTYQIMSAMEEVQGQDLVDDGGGIGLAAGIPGYFRTMTFFKVMVRAE